MTHEEFMKLSLDGRKRIEAAILDLDRAVQAEYGFSMLDKATDLPNEPQTSKQASPESETQLTLHEQLESLILVHRQANWDKNLGQYRSEHKCECGYTFVSNGHAEDSSVRVLMAEHISVQLTDLFTQALTSLKSQLPEKQPEVEGDSAFAAERRAYNRVISECQRVIDEAMK